jgi:hypothetical protein
VRTLLEPLVGVADEVLVAADSRVGAADLAEYAAVADRLLRVDVVHSERLFAWLHAQCSGDWIFRIDADEVASPDLVAALPDLMLNPDVREYWIPRVWLFPDARRWLNEPPWWPDYQLRLYRNDSFLRFAGIQHSTAVSQQPAAYLELPLYHLDLLVNSLEQREEKAALYDRLRPNMEAPGGGAMNQRYYLPERATALELGDLRDEDVGEIERVLSAGPRGEAPVPDSPVTSVAQTDLWLEGRPFDPDVHRGRIEPTETTIEMTPGEMRVIHFRVTNTGTQTWPWHNPEIYEGRQVRLSYHWFNDDGSVYEYDGLRTWLPCRIRPGGSTVIPLMVRAPTATGTYILDVDLVHERWFGCSTRVVVPVGRTSKLRASPPTPDAAAETRPR